MINLALTSDEARRIVSWYSKVFHLTNNEDETIINKLTAAIEGEPKTCGECE